MANIVVTASYDKQVRFWEAATGRTIRHFTFPDSQVNGLLLIHELHLLVVAGFGILRLYDLQASAAAVPSSGPNAATNSSGLLPPPQHSAYESQSSMNFTSLGYFPLISSVGVDSGTESSKSEDFGMTMVLPPSDNSSVNVILYATSEDGHIRFFDTRAGTLRVLKDISTKTAITCSAISPDRKYLITGSQIGQISIWHIPSIVASVSEGMMASSTHAPKGQQPGKRSCSQSGLPSCELDVGNLPLQEIAFQGDYTSIRSLAIEPLGRWCVVATNSGKLHFLRLLNEAGKVGKVGKPPAHDSEQHPLHTGCASESPLPSNSILTMHSGVIAESDSTGANQGPGESIYRSALVVNELKSYARRSPADAVLSGMQRYPGSHSIGATLIGSLEHHNSSTTPAMPQPETQATDAESVPPQKTPIQQELEMEVFYSMQAHYKYILKVAISPGSDMIVTCCADYTVGRFSVPQALRVCQRKSSSESSCGSLGSTQPGRQTKCPKDLSPEGNIGDEIPQPQGEPAGEVPSPAPLADEDPIHASASNNEEVDPSIMASAPPAATAEGQDLSTDLSFRPLKPLTGHNRWVWDCAFSECSRFLLTASSDSTVRVWNSINQERPPSTSYTVHSKPVVAILLVNNL